MKKIGVLGGTFDPIHLGHLQLAQAALEECQLDKVLFVPAVSPPHKKLATLLPFQQRYEMVELACETFPHFECSKIETELTPPTYTIDTISLLKGNNPDFQFYFIIGEDAFVEIKTWKNYEELLASTRFILCSRQSFRSLEVVALLKELGFIEKGKRWAHSHFMPVIKMSFSPDDIASTNIRNAIANSEKLSNILPSKVENYIEQFELYR